MMLFEKMREVCNLKFHLPSLNLVDQPIRYVQLPSALAGDEVLADDWEAETKEKLDSMLNFLLGFSTNLAAENYIDEKMETETSLVLYRGSEYQLELVESGKGNGWIFMFKKATRNG